MGETPTRKMIGSRTFLFTILAVSCHGLPKITGEVVPEAQTMLLQHTAAFTEMSPTAFISAMASSGGSETDCRDFATKTTTDISTTVTSTQKMLADVDTGSSCAAMGQDAVSTATAAVTAAKTELETAKTDKATKQSAKVAACSATFQVAAFNLGSFKNRQLDKACVDISGMVGYTTADAACTTATTISTAADQAVVTATTKVTNAEAALAADVKEAAKLKRTCLCRVKAAQTAAWTAASTTIASHAADWKQAHEIVCALDKSTTCTVPTCPAVTKPALAAGVANAECATWCDARSVPQDSDACLQSSGSFLNSGQRCDQYNEGYASKCVSNKKDYLRCCPVTCKGVGARKGGTGVLTEADCNSLSGPGGGPGGKCAYPNNAQCKCGGHFSPCPSMKKVNGKWTYAM